MQCKLHRDRKESPQSLLASTAKRSPLQLLWRDTYIAVCRIPHQWFKILIEYRAPGKRFLYQWCHIRRNKVRHSTSAVHAVFTDTTSVLFSSLLFLYLSCSVRLGLKTVGSYDMYIYNNVRPHIIISFFTLFIWIERCVTQAKVSCHGRKFRNILEKVRRWQRRRRVVFKCTAGRNMKSTFSEIVCLLREKNDDCHCLGEMEW